MSDTSRSAIDRRQFVKTAAVGAAAVLAAPAVLTAKKTDAEIVLGEGDYRYRVTHNWAQLPSPFEWQTTHDVAVDSDGLVYIVHEGHEERRDHPAVFVFDSDGKYVRSFGNMLAGGGHGLDIRDEGSEQFVYVTSYRPKMFAKFSMQGEEVWRRHAPMESGKYAPGEDIDNHVYGKRNNFMPTNFAFLPNGGFLVADGYGSYWVHLYDDQAKWQSCFGGEGQQDGTFKLPHGLWTDARTGREPAIVVADRMNARLQWFSLAGEHLQTLDGFILPANIDTRGDVMLVPDLAARVTLLDKDNRVIAHLGDDPAWREEVMKMEVRKDPKRWPAGRFIHPHDACFDQDGNIYVAEWVATGRITKLTRLG
jgi:hypothetical protein